MAHLNITGFGEELSDMNYTGVRHCVSHLEREAKARKSNSSSPTGL